jgi:hypothetical protein
LGGPGPRTRPLHRPQTRSCPPGYAGPKRAKRTTSQHHQKSTPGHQAAEPARRRAGQTPPATTGRDAQFPPGVVLPARPMTIRATRRVAATVTAAGVIVATGAVAATGTSRGSNTALARHRAAHVHRRVSAKISYGVDIQTVFDKAGTPNLVANFAPDGGLAKPTWSSCPLPDVNLCTPASKSQFPEPGPTPAGSVFQASATYKGHTYTARTPPWRGTVSERSDVRQRRAHRTLPRRTTGTLTEPGADAARRRSQQIGLADVYVSASSARTTSRSTSVARR